jgi:hypothetical protein
MRNRVPQKTLIATAGAILLGGSVFAAGPMIDGIGTVVISDQMSKAEVEANPTTPFDLMTEATQNLYRFPNAFDLSDYVNPGGALPSDYEATKFIFQESVDDGAKALVPVTDGEQTIQINGEVGDQSLPTPATKADFDFANDPDVWNAGDIDFLNVYRTGPDPDNPTNPSGIDGPFTDTSYISMYVAREDADDIDVDIFTVVTTNEAQFDPAAGEMVRYDFHSDAGGILTCLLVGDDMSGWLYSYQGFTGTDGAIVGDYFADPQDSWSIYTDPPALPATPGVTLESFSDEGLGGIRAAAGSDFLSLATDGTPPGLVNGARSALGAWLAPQYGGFQSYRVDLPSTYGNSIPPDQVVAGTAYMARFYIASTDATTAIRRPNNRFRIGDTGVNGIGNLSDELLDNSPSQLGDNESRIHRAYFYALADGTGYGEGFNDRAINLNYDQLDLFSDILNDDSSTQLDKVEVLSFDPADLGEGTVLMNQGGVVGTDFTLASGQPAPPDGQGDFGEEWWSQDVNLAFGVTGRPVSFVPDGVELPGTPVPAGTKSLQINYGGELVDDVAKWTTVAAALTDIGNDSLLVMDVWLSSTDGATADNTLAQTRISLLSTDAGRGALFSFNADNIASDNTEENGLLAPTPLALETGAKMYRVIIEPQSVTGTGTFVPAIEAILYDSIEWADDFGVWPPVGNGVWLGGTGAGNLTVDRVVVTSYPVPAEFISGSCE